jgi:hypothetical protein
MDATGGLLWQKIATGGFMATAHWTLPLPIERTLDEDHPLVRRLGADDAAIDLKQAAASSTIDTTELIPVWLLHLPQAWLVVPIIYREELLAFLVFIMLINMLFQMLS